MTLKITRNIHKNMCLNVRCAQTTQPHQKPSYDVIQGTKVETKNIFFKFTLSEHKKPEENR